MRDKTWLILQKVSVFGLICLKRRIFLGESWKKWSDKVMIEEKPRVDMVGQWSKRMASGQAAASASLRNSLEMQIPMSYSRLTESNTWWRENGYQAVL